MYESLAQYVGAQEIAIVFDAQMAGELILTLAAEKIVDCPTLSQSAIDLRPNPSRNLQARFPKSNGQNGYISSIPAGQRVASHFGSSRFNGLGLPLQT
eukprot:6340374-Amphidinium_carterae.1